MTSAIKSKTTKKSEFLHKQNRECPLSRPLISQTQRARGSSSPFQNQESRAPKSLLRSLHAISQQETHFRTRAGCADGCSSRYGGLVRFSWGKIQNTFTGSQHGTKDAIDSIFFKCEKVHNWMIFLTTLQKSS